MPAVEMLLPITHYASTVAPRRHDGHAVNTFGVDTLKNNALACTSGHLGRNGAAFQDSSGALSMGASKSVTASFLHDTATSTCSAPSFKFNVHGAPVEVFARDSEGAPGSLLPHAFALDAGASSSQSFHFPEIPHVYADGQARSHGQSSSADMVPAVAALQIAATGGGGHGEHGTFAPQGMDVAGGDGGSRVQQVRVCMRLPTASALAAPPFAALTPSAPCPAPSRLETVDEHTPSPMHPLQASRLQLPPGCVGKACPGAGAGMMHMSYGMHGEPSPDITWSPLRPRNVHPPSPNYCSPAALGAMHGHAVPGHAMYAYGHAQLPMLEAAIRHSAGGQVAVVPAPVPHAPLASDDAAGSGCDGTAVGADRRCVSMGRLPWLCMTSPRTRSADGEDRGDGCVSEAVGEAGGSWLERERGFGVAVWRRQREDAGTAVATTCEENAPEQSLPYNGSTLHAPVQGNGADISTSIGGATNSSDDFYRI